MQDLVWITDSLVALSGTRCVNRAKCNHVVIAHTLRGLRRVAAQCCAWTCLVHSYQGDEGGCELSVSMKLEGYVASVLTTERRLLIKMKTCGAAFMVGRALNVPFGRRSENVVGCEKTLPTTAVCAMCLLPACSDWTR